MAPTRKTGFIYHSVFAWIDVGNGALGPTNSSLFIQPTPPVGDPNTKRRAFELIEATGLLKQLERVDAVPATREDVELFHTAGYLDQIIKGDQQHSGHDLKDGTTHFGKGNYAIGLLAVGAGLTLTEMVMKGELDNAFGLVAPPGHHASPEQGMGFCMFNNVAICAEAAIKRFGAKRVAIVDFDVHHGNGAEKGFYTRKDILTISIHQHLCYPLASGYAHLRGEGEGEGYNLNLPLPPGCGNAAYLDTFDRVILPQLASFKPDLILAAAGLDANINDPMSRQLVTTIGFRAITDRLVRAAEELCGGRLVVMQEGGYSQHYVPFCIKAVVEGLVGAEAKDDPFSVFTAAQYGVNEHEPHQKAVVDGFVTMLSDK